MTAILSEFAARAKAAANRTKLQVTVRSELLGTQFRGNGNQEILKGLHLPLEIETMTIGRFSILLGRLAITPDVMMVQDGTRRYRNQCVIARSHLRPEEALDLQLWLVGPDGSGDSPEWIAVALAIERDDRVARKLVWLPPSDPSSRDISFDHFISRTFLARPWEYVEQAKNVQLDRLSSLHKIVAGLGVEPTVLSSWFELASSELTDGPELVDALVDSWESNTP